MARSALQLASKQLAYADRPGIERVSPVRLLIVDDDGDQVETSCRVLAAQGFVTTGATSAEHALVLLGAAQHDEAHFDILIADLIMPGMDGIGLMHAAREIDPDLVGVIMTGRATIDTAIDAMKSGAVDYIIKPFTLDVLIPVLSRALALKRLRAANALRLQQRANEAAKLETANRELSLANTELDAFTRSVSHDLRQPISQIIGFAELLCGEKVGPLNEKQRELFHYIDKGGRQLLRLTDDLLRFSRLSNQPVSKVRVDVAAMLREIWDPMRMAEPLRKIEFRVAELPSISGDRSLLRLAFTNLLSNACKFTRHKATAIIEITGKSEPGKNSYCIRDNGAGFAMAGSQQLFGIFQRLHGDQEFEGTGVGLSIVKRIVERHGGTIAATAVLGEGAAFTIELPHSDVE